MKPPPGIPQFGQVPLLGQRPQQLNDDQKQQQMQAQVQAAIGQLSMGIYIQLASAPAVPFDPDTLRKLAKDSQVAARSYFEGIGVIVQNQEETT
jgi:hypothetical protein